MLRMLVYVVPIALAIYALIDLYRSEANERAGLQPLLWALLIVVIPVVGPLAWIAVSTVQRAGAGQRPATPHQSVRPTSPKGPVAPDDDPEFLWRLDQERRRERGQDGGGSPGGGDSGPGA